MRILLLGATEGLRYRLSEMIASALPGTELMALDYDATMPPQVWKPGCDVALCTVGRVEIGRAHV